MKFHLFSFFLSLFVLTFSGTMYSTELELRGTWTYNVEKGKFLLHGGTILNKDRNHASDSIKIEVWMYPHDFKTTIDSIQLISEVVAPVPRNFLSPKYELSGWFRSGYPLGNYSVKMRILEYETSSNSFRPRAHFKFPQNLKVSENIAVLSWHKYSNFSLELDTSLKVFRLYWWLGLENNSVQVSSGRIIAEIVLAPVDQKDTLLSFWVYEMQPIQPQHGNRFMGENRSGRMMPYQTPPVGTYKVLMTFWEEQLDGKTKPVCAFDTGQVWHF